MVKKRKTVLKEPRPDVNKHIGGTCTCKKCGAQTQTIDEQACIAWIEGHIESCRGSGPSECRGIDHKGETAKSLMLWKPSGLINSRPRPKIRQRK